MNRFKSSTPRVALGIAAVAMTVVTFGLLVVVPATIDSSGEGGRTQAMSKLVTPAAVKVVTTAAPSGAFDGRERHLAGAG